MSGVDARGAQYVVPVQAKGGKDTLGVIQTIQDTIFCQQQEKYAHSIPRPVSAQFMAGDVIALFEPISTATTCLSFRSVTTG
jgi:hypothetical protein